MQINPVYGRLAAYIFLPMLGTVPGVTVDMAAGVITIDIDAAIAGVALGIAASGGIFAKWGKK
jgi:hypothetical protein